MYMRSGVEFFTVMSILKRFQILEHFRFWIFWIRDTQPALSLIFLSSFMKMESLSSFYSCNWDPERASNLPGVSRAEESFQVCLASKLGLTGTVLWRYQAMKFMCIRKTKVLTNKFYIHQLSQVLEDLQAKQLVRERLTRDLPSSLAASSGCLPFLSQPSGGPAL
jgi:hypothetical protein